MYNSKNARLKMDAGISPALSGYFVKTCHPEPLEGICNREKGK